MMNYEISKDIQIICEYLSLTKQDLAKLLGVSFETLSRLSNNHIDPSIDVLEKFYSFVFKHGIELNLSKVKVLQAHHDIVLFHGSKKEIVGELSLDYSRNHVDFGKGFYVGDNYEQAAEFIANMNESSVYAFEVDYTNLKVLKLDVSMEWMNLIALNRGHLEKYKNTQKYQQLLDQLSSYDVIIAPIADMRMADTINDFVNGLIPSEPAMHALKSLHLGDQIVFKTMKALKQLKPLERFYLCREEKRHYLQKKLEEVETVGEEVFEIYQKYAGQGQYVMEIFQK